MTWTFYYGNTDSKDEVTCAPWILTFRVQKCDIKNNALDKAFSLTVYFSRSAAVEPRTTGKGYNFGHTTSFEFKRNYINIK